MTGNVAMVFTTDEQWGATVVAVHAAVRPGGRFVFETRIPERQAWLELDAVVHVRAGRSGRRRFGRLLGRGPGRAAAVRDVPTGVRVRVRRCHPHVRLDARFRSRERSRDTGSGRVHRRPGPRRSQQPRPGARVHRPSGLTSGASPASRAKPRQRHRQSTSARPASRIQLELVVDRRQPVLGIVGGATDGGEELGVRAGCGRLDDLEVGERAARRELGGDLAEQRPLAVVGEMVDGEPRHDEVEACLVGDGSSRSQRRTRPDRRRRSAPGRGRAWARSGRRRRPADGRPLRSPVRPTARRRSRGRAPTVARAADDSASTRSPARRGASRPMRSRYQPTWSSSPQPPTGVAGPRRPSSDHARRPTVGPTAIASATACRAARGTAAVALTALGRVVGGSGRCSARRTRPRRRVGPG